MKRELAYREEMVQQLQIVRGKAEPTIFYCFNSLLSCLLFSFSKI